MELGSIIVETQKHLQQFENSSLRYYKATLFAGKSGRILGKLRGHEVISNIDKIIQFAAETGEYDDQNLLKNLLPSLEDHGCVNLYRDSAGNITKIEENITSENDILKVVTEIWEERNPTAEEQVSLEVLDYCSKLPRVKSELHGYIADSGFGNKGDVGIALSQDFNLIQVYDNVPGIEECIYHSPLFLRDNIIKIANTIKKLPDIEREKLEKLLNGTKIIEANPLSKIRIDKGRLDVYNKVGLIDITEIQTIGGRKECFLFTPSMWGPLGTVLTKDEQEHVRALLSCIRFGQICPTSVDGCSYKIKYPERYIEALEKRGKIGPATAIGSDYTILEREGIVKIERSKSKSGQFEMILIKHDIAERARRIISFGKDISISEEKQDTEPLRLTGQFNNTAQSRNMRTKNTGARSELLERDIMRILRGEKD